LKANSKKIINKYNKKEGHKASNETKLMNLNKSKTFTTVEKLCRLYLGQASETFAEVKEKKMYIMWTDVAEQAV
jgi:hypothetical protein